MLRLNLVLVGGFAKLHFLIKGGLLRGRSKGGKIKRAFSVLII
jgi:hypothetical protein